MSDALCYAISQTNPQLALKAFQSSGSPDRVDQELIEAG